MVNKMNKEEEKAAAFITRLLSNPSLNFLNPLQKEEQITTFLELNAVQLFPTLSSPAFFSGKTWTEILSILQPKLASMVDEMIEEGIKRHLFEKMDFGFLSSLPNSFPVNEKIIQSLYDLIIRTLKTNSGRLEFIGSYNALLYKLPHHYLDDIFESQTYIHFELIKVQRLKMSKAEILNMIRVSLLMRPALHLYSEGVFDKSSGLITKQYAVKIEKLMKKDLPRIPDELISSAVKSYLPFEKYRFVPTTGRLTSIFNAMGKTIRPHGRVDRGASSPEKSWMSVSRRNYKYYGWDIKMLDELYRYSLENNW